MFEKPTRRQWLKQSAIGLAAGSQLLAPNSLPTIHAAQQEDRPDPGERPFQIDGVEVINPRGKVPISFIIDDSCCLVNLAHFCIPHFAEVYPSRYKQDWQSLPREIPDSFVMKFIDWCDAHGVKGKYSVVPYPACVGWVDRDMPGWTRKELQQSIRLVQDRVMPNWDIHPEMVTHTFVIDTKTGRPYSERTEKQLENTGWSVGRSADEIADYMSYALRILKNAGLPCEGVTTPGGFGNRARRSLSLATLQSCRDVFSAEIPHYFRHLYTDNTSVVPRIENATGLDSDDPQCAVSIIGCTGDWFGGWDGLVRGSADRFITPDLKSGRMIDVIEKGEPAIMVCHWPGIYFNGEEVGFDIFKTVVQRLHERYDHLRWMKLSEIARYWAAKELTEIRQGKAGEIHLQAPFASPDFTLKSKRPGKKKVTIRTDSEQRDLRLVDSDKLDEDTFSIDDDAITLNMRLTKGESWIVFE